MTRYLFTTLPTNDLGLLTRSLPVARELSARGHEVTFCSPAKAPSRLIAEAGFENLIPRHPLYDLSAVERTPGGFLRFIGSEKFRARYGSLWKFLRMLIAAIPLRWAKDGPGETWNLDRAGAAMGMLNAGFVRANCDALRELIAGSRADVVVDFFNPLAVIAARSLHKPLVTVIQANAHPDSPDQSPDRRPPIAESPVPVVNRVMDGYGLPPLETLAELSTGDLTLVVGMPETDPLPEDADVTYIGPLLWQNQSAALPEWIDALRRDRPIIWVYSGNPRYSVANGAFDSIAIVHACIAALADEDAQVVLTTGHHELPEEVLPLPANFRHEAFVPGLAMAERADLLIHHGGYGSCQTGLYAGKPAVIMPTYSERASNAQQIAALGAGIVVPVETAAGRKHVRPEALRAAVRQALGEPSFGACARQISRKMRAFGGAAVAAEMIEAFGAGAQSHLDLAQNKQQFIK